MKRLSSLSVEGQTFSASRLRRLSEIERQHFWFAGRRTLIQRHVARYFARQSTVLDLGCGTGWQLESLAAEGYSVTGLDLRPEGLHATRQRLPQAALIQATLAEPPPFARCSFDGILALDVLEHADDEAVLVALHRILKPGGVLILSVPALPRLWSYRDVAAGHLRRYTRTHLEGLLRRTGFRVLELHYYQFLLLPILALTRLLGKKGPTLRDMEDLPSPVLNGIFGLITDVEVGLGRWVTWPCGSTLIAVCTR